MVLRRASDAEKAEYLQGSPVYPLSHWVDIGGVRCAVERLSSYHRDDPQYEIVLPEGYHDAYECLHTLLCFDLKDVRERAGYVRLTACSEHCR